MATLYGVEHLNVWAWLIKIFPYLISQRLKGAAVIKPLYFIDATKPGYRLAYLLRWLTGVSPQALAFSLVDIHDEEGLLIRLRIAYRDLAQIQSEILRGPIFKEYTAKISPEEPLFTYFAKSIAPISKVERNTLWRVLFLVHAFRAELIRRSIKDGKVLIFLESRPWQMFIAQYAARYDVLVRFTPLALSLRRWLCTLITARGVLLAKSLRNLWYNRVHLRTRRGGLPDQRLESPSAKIMIQYSGHFNLEVPGRYSDLFFWQQSQLAGRDLLLSFGFPQDPLDTQKWERLKQEGVSALALYPGASRVSAIPLFVYSPFRALFARVPKDFPKPVQNIETRWLRVQERDYYVQRQYWRDLFAAQGVKMYVSWYRYDRNHCVITDAIRQVGGISVIYQRALQMDTSAEISINADIMFGYAPLDAQVERNSGSMIRYHVAVGYLHDYLFPVLRPEAAVVRRHLQAAGAEFIVAYLDESSGDDSRWHTSHEFMWQSYEFILRKVLTEPGLGLVLKPKFPSTLRKRLGPVADLLSLALATGRCYIYEEGRLHAARPPALAALASDVAIHGNLCAGSAGFECALAGVPTLLLDREGWHVSPLYQLGVGRVVFRSWYELWSALMEYRRRPEGLPGFGDWSAMINALDPFRDGRAAERVGTYLQWLVEGFKAGRSREEALDSAAQRYQQLWGKDKINSVGY